LRKGIIAHGAEEDGVAVWDWRAARQASGSKAASSPVGVAGKRVSTSCRYAHGSTPCRWHVDVLSSEEPLLEVEG
jgi:hypothetical protein